MKKQGYGENGCVLADYDGIPLEHYKPSEGEVIVARYKFGEMSCESLRKQYEILRAAFCGNVVLMIPDNLSLEKLSQDDLTRFRNRLDEIISIKQSSV